jgi:mannose-1-phosphate guanylyltransferase
MASGAGVVAAIMAGGRGERFWPRSQPHRPKQFLALADRHTLLQATYHRLAHALGDPSRILVVTGQEFVAEVRRQLPGLLADNVLSEPVGRDTAACVALAALEARRRWGNPVLAMVPADHAVWDEGAFADALRDAAGEAAPGRVVLLGLRPTRPETGYGYIRLARVDAQERTGGRAGLPVDRFVEKPTRRRALTMLRSGRYLWNCGVFVFPVETGLAHIRTLLPDLWAGVARLEPHLGSPAFATVAADVYATLPKVSFDRGVLERVRGLRVVRADFPWDDVGSWLALERLPSRPRRDDGNVVLGEAVTLDSRGCIVDAPADGRLVVLFGVHDLVVVDTEDALLVTHKNSAADLKTLVNHLKQIGRYPA